ncbi:MAG: glycosyltransferase family 2 protein, partial [Candidatus Eisenbacteria bacterium]|nr:glycosyltransferase family 2 protein [Candidatus Eisenbacteria bacterium]
GSIWEYDDRFPTRARLLRYALLAPRDPGRLHDVGRLLGPELHETDWLAGACLFLRRDALERAGAFDESFFLYREDVDLCHRLRIHGFRIARHRGVSLAHSAAQSSRRNPGRDGGRTRIEGMRSQVLYARKRFGLPFAVALALALRL